MAYLLNGHRPLGDELRRVYEQQLDAAVECLIGRAPRDGDRIHACRTHVKKARAVLELLGRRVGAASARAERELKVANRALGGLADAHRAICVATELKGDRGVDGLLPHLRAALVFREDSLERRAEHDDQLARVARLLTSARRRIAEWPIGGIDRAYMARALADAHSDARLAARRAIRAGTVKAHHRWRRRVKNQWYMFRLIAEHTGGQLVDDQHRLAALDACLGRLHDAHVLASIMIAEPMLPRRQTALVLMTLRRLASDQRRTARVLSRVLDDRPQDLKRRVKALWGLPVGRRSGEESSCQPAA